MDGIAVYFTDLKTPGEHVKQVLKRLKRNSIFLKASNCIAVNELDFVVQ